MNFDSELFAQDIKDLYWDKRISMSKAAIEIGISKATLSRVLNNKLPDIGSLIRIIKWLKSPLERYIL